MKKILNFNKHLSPKKLVYLLAGLFVLMGALMFLSGYTGSDELKINEDGEYVVEFHEDGFAPQDITIKKGETVRFVNLTDKPFWPASNTHPSHGAYSEFDPKQPVEGGESWAFTFDKIGRWVYHDHIYSWFLGRVNVTDENGSLVSSNCNMESLATGAEPEEGSEQCWENLIYEGMVDGGVRKAFDVFAELYEIDDDFVTSDCHARAHDVGDLAYAIWRESGDLDAMEIPPESVYCNYGYFHGMIGHMIEENNDPQYLAEVCTYLEENYSDIIPQAALTCYHAAGHGLTLPPTDLSIWGKPQDIVEDALNFCEQIPTDRLNIGECYRGVYNVLTLWIWQDEFGLTPDYDDPLALCAQQENEEMQEACYYEFGMYLTHSNDRTESVDVVDAARRHIDKVENDSIAQMLVHVLVAGEVTKHLLSDDLSQMVYDCNQMQPRLQDSCFSAILGGVVAHGTPGKEHLEGIEFCKSDSAKSRKDLCYVSLFNSLRWVYSEDMIHDMCSLIDEEDQYLCYEDR